MANLLADSLSPYLRQHAGNPVDWHEWGEAALAEARERDVPILLSIGYAACHWCHVMAHESFEDEATAAVMNEHFVCVKVDREERPDLDAIYMNATVATTGQGGWPMTCFLTPDGAPFYCGTYYPSTPRGGMPSFQQLLHAITDTWHQRRDDVGKAAAAIVGELQRSSGGLPPGAGRVDAALLDAAVSAVARDEDREHGGFGGAPKFPPSNLLEGLLRGYERTRRTDTLDLVSRTAEAMARGGIYDQLGGGFARYSVDAGWVVPHFEKMLYDNALLLRFYAHLARVTGAVLFRRVAEETATFLLRDLLTAEGGFASALDADTDGIEGLTYAWAPAQLAEVLGPDDGAWAAHVFSVTREGTFEAGTSVLQLRDDPDDAERFARVRERLLLSRQTRPQPARDDKVVTVWNGFAVTALAEAGVAFGVTEWIEAAATCARTLLDRHLVDGRLRRASLGGVVGEPAGVLEDYGAFVTALVALHQATGDASWLAPARGLADTALAAFADQEKPGSWFDTAHDATTLVARPRDPMDGATPAGASLIAEALLSLSALEDGDGRYATAAHASLAAASILLERAPRSAGHWLTVAEAAVRGPLQVAVAGGGDLLRAARHAAPGGAIVVGGDPGSSPLLVDRPLVDGVPTAYVCRGFVCDRPVTSVPDLLDVLAAS
ncbi:thioredoxin domain-containing protein [Rhodococcus sp. (in: high G+C Gram-positive bacteria)]|uniref:thioredoxin domain-containing protein n=2 Tax=Rhodococcus sp. TaxID=1831 RepID=UPI0019E83818|nr:thioredoxin domain-containing protein [Rhodococcus sp. (in: high G+C Gram-positive bacteria)]MBF0663084.1 thioredoxin domain-containing protein [Rhodococcus sp. (in: high G+C Gram-positive bacteria)]